MGLASSAINVFTQSIKLFEMGINEKEIILNLIHSSENQSHSKATTNSVETCHTHQRRLTRVIRLMLCMLPIGDLFPSNGFRTFSDGGKSEIVYMVFWLMFAKRAIKQRSMQ